MKRGPVAAAQNGKRSSHEENNGHLVLMPKVVGVATDRVSAPDFARLSCKLAPSSPLHYTDIINRNCFRMIDMESSRCSRTTRAKSTMPFKSLSVDSDSWSMILTSSTLAMMARRRLSTSTVEIVVLYKLGDAMRVFQGYGVKAPFGQALTAGRSAGKWAKNVKSHGWLYFIHDKFHAEGDASSMRQRAKQALVMTNVEYPGNRKKVAK